MRFKQTYELTKSIAKKVSILIFRFKAAAMNRFTLKTIAFTLVPISIALGGLYALHGFGERASGVIPTGASSLSAIQPSKATLSMPREKKQVRLENYGELPLSFEANEGQTNPEVKFLARGKGYSLLLTHTEAVLALQPGKPEPKGSDLRKSLLKADLTTAPEQTPPAVVRLKLLGGRIPLQKS